jgi:hypothetical protein
MAHVKTDPGLFQGVNQDARKIWQFFVRPRLTGRSLPRPDCQRRSEKEDLFLFAVQLVALGEFFPAPAAYS